MINIEVISLGTQNVVHLVSHFSYSLSSLPVTVFTSSLDIAFLFSICIFLVLAGECQKTSSVLISFPLFFSNSAFSKVFRNHTCTGSFLFLFYLYWFPNLPPPALISPLVGSLCCFSHKVKVFLIFASELYFINRFLILVALE